MAHGLPDDFQSLLSATATPNEDVNVMGVVTDALPPSPTKGIDWQFSFSIQDEAEFGSGFRVKYFMPSKDLLPRITSTGDVIMLRKIKYKEFRGTFFFLSNRATQWIVIPAQSIPETQPDGALELPFIADRQTQAMKVKPTPAEYAYATTLCNSRDRTNLALIPSQAANITMGSSAVRDKFALIEAIKDGVFYDLIVQVVKFYDDNGRLMIYVTDFTNNKLLYNYSKPLDESGPGQDDSDENGGKPAPEGDWQGPFGQFTLAVTLWEPHNSWCREHVKVGQYIHLNNLRIKFGNDSQRLEGVMHTDKQHDTRVNVSRVEFDEAHVDEKLKDFLRRKEDFIGQFGDWTRRTLRKRDTPAEPDSKRARKKKRQNEKKEKGDATTKEGQPVLNNLPARRKDTRETLNKLNQSIACNNNEVTVRHLSTVLDRERVHRFETVNGNILQQPWQNRCRRVNVRVVDFFPPDLRDFAVRDRVSEFDYGKGDDEKQESIERKDTEDDKSDISDNSSDHSVRAGSRDSTPGTPKAVDDVARGYRYAWRFALLVEDRETARGSEPVQMVVNVGGDAASFLLGLEPCDLHKKKNRQRLAQLRDKLFILWGDLEEVKQSASEGGVGDAADGNAAAATKNPSEVRKAKCVPFQCCIEEYGVRLPGAAPLYERRFALTGTRIK